MTVNELVQELQRPDLAVHIPCPHRCGQRDTDFDLLDAEHVVQTERDGRQVGLLGDTRQQCFEDRRSDSRTRVRTAAAGRASELAAGLGLQYVRTLTRTDFERMYQDIREGHHIARSRSSRLRRTNLMTEATDGQDTHYVMVETPFRATPEDIAPVRMGVELMTELMTELTGCASHAVVACVVRDSSAEADIASGEVHWHLMDRVTWRRNDRRSRPRPRKTAQMRGWAESHRCGAVVRQSPHLSCRCGQAGKTWAF